MKDKRRMKPFRMSLLLGLMYAFIMFLPSYYFIAIYMHYVGRAGALAIIIIPFMWLFVINTCVRKMTKHHFKKKENIQRPFNMMDDVMDALDKLSNGDYNIQVDEGDAHRYNELAVKVNKLARDLSTMEQMRSEFVANVSHEIQSPLTSISGFAALLKKRDLPPEQQLHYLDVIESESKRLSRLSDNLLKLTMLDSSDKSSVDLQPFRLDKQVEDIVLMLEPQWSAKQLEPELNLERVTFSGDEELLSQVWINLLHNAIKFTPNGGQFSVALKQEEKQIRFTITDTGAGIPEENLARIYERFYKVDKARDRSLGGNGLGLSIVKKIVDLHDGSIAVDSAADAGTTFEIMLPVDPE